MLPEYELVMGMEGIGKVTGPQLMAEVGDVRRFSHKGALVDSVGGITRTRPVSRLPAPGCVFLLEGQQSPSASSSLAGHRQAAHRVGDF